MKQETEMTEVERLMIMRNGLVTERRGIANNATAKKSEAFNLAERVQKYQEMIEAIDRAIADEKLLAAQPSPGDAALS
jgi:hypothetical protein